MGRIKGSKNKFTSLKDSFLNAYQAKDGFGGDDALKKFARDNPGDFLAMIKTMLPKQVEQSGELDLKMQAPSIHIHFGKDGKKTKD